MSNQTNNDLNINDDYEQPKEPGTLYHALVATASILVILQFLVSMWR